jgi:ribosome-associated protein
VTSKSERKRQLLALQKLGERLIALSETDLASLSLDERLHRAIRDAASIRSRGALRRQKQLIGKLMQGVDPEPIETALAKLNADDIAAKRLFARAERWRDRLVKDGREAINAFRTETGTDDDALAPMVAELEVAFDDRTRKTLRREIFRRVHEILGKIPQ